MDGGETWVPNPSADPRLNPAYNLPPNTEPDPPCAAAAGMVENVRKTLTAMASGVALAGAATQALGFLLIPGVGWLFTAFLLFAGGLFLAGAGATAAAFTEEVYEWLLCAYRDQLDGDGRITTEGLQAVVDAADDEQPNPLVAGFLDLIHKAHGFVGFNNAGVTYADPAAECTCGWCYVLDLSTTDGGWSPYGSGQGHWQSGVGIVADNVVVGVQRTILQGTFPLGGTVAITEIAMNYSYHAGSLQSGVVAVGGTFNDFAESWANIDMNDAPEGDNMLIDQIVDADVYNIFIDIQCSHNAYGGSGTALVMTLRGVEEAPTFLEAYGWVPC